MDYHLCSAENSKGSLCSSWVYTEIMLHAFCDLVVYFCICPAVGHAPAMVEKRKSKQEKFVVFQDCCLFLQGNGKVYLAFTTH